MLYKKTYASLPSALAVVFLAVLCAIAAHSMNYDSLVAIVVVGGILLSGVLLHQAIEAYQYADGPAPRLVEEPVLIQPGPPLTPEEKEALAKLWSMTLALWVDEKQFRESQIVWDEELEPP